jgi:thiol-disulfide isomerase/thioredoxin
MKTLLLILSLIMGSLAFSQSDKKPYQRFPGLPPLKILMSDSATFYTKEAIPPNLPVLIMLFSPDCSHCQHETEEMMANREATKGLQIIMVTLDPLYKMNKFIADYKLNEMPNIMVGKDIYFTLPSFYDIKNLPYLALYNSKGEVFQTFEGTVSFSKVLDEFKKVVK